MGTQRLHSESGHSARSKERAGYFVNKRLGFDHKEPENVREANWRLPTSVFFQSTQQFTRRVPVMFSLLIHLYTILADLLSFSFWNATLHSRGGFFVRKARPDYGIGHRIRPKVHSHVHNLVGGLVERSVGGLVGCSVGGYKGVR